MERKEFLKNGFGFLGMALVAPNIILDNNAPEAACKVTRTETIGPFPTKNPANFLKSDIIDNRTGIPFSIEITMKNIKDNCNPIPDLIVDIWHCDKDGYYSEYGGASNPFQTKDMTKEHFLRGRQITDSNGLVKFKSIFPGWYQGRATHIHVHAYTKKGADILVTQIAYPEGPNSAVVQVNNSAANGYTKGMNGYTYNATDGEFRDGVDDEMSEVTGSIAAGFTLTHTIFVSAPVVPTGVEEELLPAEGQFKLGANYPNPVANETIIPVTLLRNSDVKLEILDLQGRKVLEIQKENLEHGVQNIPVNLAPYNLASGRYVYAVEIRNENGTFKQAKMLVKAAPAK